MVKLITPHSGGKEARVGYRKVPSSGLDVSQKKGGREKKKTLIS